MRWFGALLVLLSGALAGISAADSARRKTRLAERAEQMTRLFQTLVCARRLSLPEAVACLHEEYPLWFPDFDSLRQRLLEESFAGIWADTVHGLALPARMEESLASLGKALSAEEEPERCFGRTLSELAACREQCSTREKELVRLTPALGLCAGALLAIVLL